MKLAHIIPLAAVAVGIASSCQALDLPDGIGSGFVYTMTNAADNAILEFHRAPDGRLSQTALVSTGGAGTGANLGSDSALALSAGGRWLFAVNAASNSISVLERRATGLKLVNTVSSGGTQPESVAVSGDLVYVLNDGAPANISGFFFDGERGVLVPIENSSRPLSTAAPVAPQIGFDNTGSVVFVTEKATNLIDSFVIGDDDTPGSGNFQNSNGQTPFGFAFDRRNHLIVSEAFGGAPNQGAMSSYDVDDQGNIATISGSVSDLQTAPCWVAITRNGKFAYTSNTGDGVITGYRISNHGELSLLNPSGISATTGGAKSSPVDIALTRESRFLYSVNAGAGTLIGWRVQADGQLISLQQVLRLPLGATGLVAR